VNQVKTKTTLKVRALPPPDPPARAIADAAPLLLRRFIPRTPWSPTPINLRIPPEMNLSASARPHFPRTPPLFSGPAGHVQLVRRGLDVQPPRRAAQGRPRLRLLRQGQDRRVQERGRAGPRAGEEAVQPEEQGLRSRPSASRDTCAPRPPVDPRVRSRRMGECLGVYFAVASSVALCRPEG
jgi:hypothetical protein